MRRTRIGPLVAVRADAVAGRFNKVFVVGAVTCVGDDLAGRDIDSLALNAEGRPAASCCGLGFVDDVEDLLLLVGGLAEDEGTRRVGLVAFDGGRFGPSMRRIVALGSHGWSQPWAGRSTRRPGRSRRRGSRRRLYAAETSSLKWRLVVPGCADL